MHVGMNFQDDSSTWSMENGKKNINSNMSMIYPHTPCSLAYGVKMLEGIIEAHKKNKIYVIYDIACTMQKHLQVQYIYLMTEIICYTWIYRCLYNTYSLSIGQIFWIMFTCVSQPFIAMATKCLARCISCHDNIWSSVISTCILNFIGHLWTSKMYRAWT